MFVFRGGLRLSFQALEVPELKFTYSESSHQIQNLAKTESLLIFVVQKMSTGLICRAV